MRDSGFPFSIYKETGKGRVINARCHKSKMEMIEITSGEVKLQVGTETVNAKRGDIVHFFCNTPEISTKKVVVQHFALFVGLPGNFLVPILVNGVRL